MRMTVQNREMDKGEGKQAAPMIMGRGKIKSYLPLPPYLFVIHFILGVSNNFLIQIMFFFHPVPT